MSQNHINLQKASDELVLAIWQGNIDKVKGFIAVGADVNAKGKNPSCSHRVNQNSIAKFTKSTLETPLNMAILNGSLPIAALLCDNGAQATKNSLSYAVSFNRFAIVDFLIERGAQPDAKMLFSTSLDSSGEKMVLLLLERGVDPMAKNYGGMDIFTYMDQEDPHFTAADHERMIMKVMRQRKRAARGPMPTIS